MSKPWSADVTGWRLCPGSEHDRLASCRSGSAIYLAEVIREEGKPHERIKIAVIVGSLRRDSFNRKLAGGLMKLGPPDFSFRPNWRFAPL